MIHFRTGTLNFKMSTNFDETILNVATTYTELAASLAAMGEDGGKLVGSNCPDSEKTIVFQSLVRIRDLVSDEFLDILCSGPMLKFFATFLNVKVNSRATGDIAKDVKNVFLGNETALKPEIDSVSKTLLDAANSQNSRLHGILVMERDNLVAAGQNVDLLPALKVLTTLQNARAFLKLLLTFQSKIHAPSSLARSSPVVPNISYDIHSQLPTTTSTSADDLVAALSTFLIKSKKGKDSAESIKKLPSITSHQGLHPDLGKPLPIQFGQSSELLQGVLFLDSCTSHGTVTLVSYYERRIIPLTTLLFKHKKPLAMQFLLSARRLDCFMSSKELMSVVRSTSPAFLEMEGRQLMSLFLMITQDLSWEKVNPLLEIYSVESLGPSPVSKPFLIKMMRDQERFEKAKKGKFVTEEEEGSG